MSEDAAEDGIVNEEAAPISPDYADLSDGDEAGEQLAVGGGAEGDEGEEREDEDPNFGNTSSTDAALRELNDEMNPEGHLGAVGEAPPGGEENLGQTSSTAAALHALNSEMNKVPADFTLTGALQEVGWEGELGGTITSFGATNSDMSGLDVTHTSLTSSSTLAETASTDKPEDGNTPVLDGSLTWAPGKGGIRGASLTSVPEGAVRLSASEVKGKGRKGGLKGPHTVAAFPRVESSGTSVSKQSSVGMRPDSRQSGVSGGGEVTPVISMKKQREAAAEAEAAEAKRRQSVLNQERAEQMAKESKIMNEWLERFPVPAHSYNNVEEILKHCYLATKSTKLDLAKMGLVDPLPIDVYTIYYIKQILLNDNHLISVSPLLGNPRLGAVIQLNLSNNLLTQLPEELGNLTELVFLMLHKNHLRSVPKSLEQLSKLQRLTIHENQLHALPTNWHSMRQIEELTFLDNPYKYPQSVWQVYYKSFDGETMEYYSSLAPLRLSIKNQQLSHKELLNLESDIIKKTRDQFFDYLHLLDEAPRTHKISLRRRGFARIPPEVLCMTYLTELDLAHNHITSLPPQLKYFHNSLTAMDLSYNRLSSLPIDLIYLTKLDECSFEGMLMEFVPKVIRSAGIKNVLRFITEMQHGKDSGTLSLTGMGLSSIPDEVLAMTNLTELHLEDNKFHEVTPMITVLVRLKSFYINGNPLRTIPWEFELFTALERISVLDCPIEELPLGLCKMKNLREIRTYSHEMIPRPPEPALSTDDIVQKTMILLDQFELMMKAYETRTLVLADMALSFFPNEAFQITSLTILDISMNNFSKLPNVIGNLNNLEVLRLCYNYIPAIEFEWSGMTSLKTIRIEYNCIAAPLDPSFGTLTNLTELYAHDNKLPNIPQQMSNCASLTHLDLCYNDIGEVPPLRGLASLKWVDLRHNRLTVFPREAFGYLSTLEYLDLSFNKITRFPPAGEWPRKDRTVSFSDHFGFPFDELVHSGGTGGDGSDAWGGHMLDFGEREMSLRWGDKLKTLRFHGNYISVLPWDLWVLTSVVDLSYEPSVILVPTQEVVVRGWGMMRCYMRHWDDAIRRCELDLSNFKFLNVPTEVFLFDKMTRLDISHNRIGGTLDPAFAALTNLSDLDISHNMLVSFHPSLLLLTSLCDGWNLTQPLESSEDTHGGIRWMGNRFRSPPFNVMMKGTRYIFAYMNKMMQALSSAQLDLEALNLKHMPYEILRLTNITMLSLAGNYLSVVPPVITVLCNLLDLNVDRNRLSIIHPDMAKLRKLERLSLKDNVLNVLPHELCSIPSLVNLLTSGNPMGGPPEGQKIRLEELLDGYAGKEQPIWMHEILSSGVAPEASIVYLKVWLTCRGSKSLAIQPSLILDVRSLCLDALPHEVWDFHWSAKMQKLHTMMRITELLLDDNPLSRLPLEVRGWEYVEKIACNNCLLRDIPRVLGDWQQLPCLRVLEAADNGLRTFPAYNGGWTSLERLDLDRNDFVALTPDFGYLTGLTILTLRHNKLEMLPCSLWRMKALKTLFIQNNSLTRLPPEIGALSAIFPPIESIEMREHLKRGGSVLEYVARPPGSAIPAMPVDKIGRSTWRAAMRGCETDGESVYGSLVDFRFDDNEFFWSPPPEVQAQGKPAMYRYLRTFFDCRFTRAVDLHDMGLLRLPPEVMEVAWSLQSLWLGFNDLETLPVCIEELSGLKTLHIHHNRITRLPPTVGLRLIQLTDLDISHNHMHRIPLEFANLKSLKSFELRNNPWEMIPEEMVGRGTITIIYFLQNLKDSVHGILDMMGMGLTTNGMTYVKRGVPDPNLIHSAHFDDNYIRKLPKSFHTFTNLTALTIDKNQLQLLPPWIPVLRELVRLSVSKNQIHEIEPGIGECVLLEKINLDNNFIKYIPATFAVLTKVTMLRLENNKLIVVNPCISYMQSLQRLWISLNDITMLPPELSFLTNLYDLRLDTNPLKSPPAEILSQGPVGVLSYLRQLTIAKDIDEIDLKDMMLLHVPFEITYLTNLTKLDLDKNRLKNLWPLVPLPAPTLRDKAVIVGGGYWAYRGGRTPVWEEPEDPLALVGPMDGQPTPSIKQYPVHLLGNLVNLQTLSVRHNWITELPGRCFPRFQTSLRELLLDHNRLTVLPFQMHTLDVLESFSMEGNDIKNPPLNYEKEGFPTLRKYWKRIEASEKTGILELVNMSLLMFPPELALEPRYSHALRYLDLSGNRIPTLHPNIDNMTNLETLRMDNNLITVLPGEVFKCTNLVELNLDNNMIDDLPAMVGECTRLTNLSLNNNRLSAVPEEMAMLTGLIKLGLGDNQFVLGTAWWLAALTCLQSLWLHNNKLIALPVAIGVLTNLDDLRVEGNPLKDPPAKVLANGLKAVREYMAYNVKYESDQSGLAPPRVKRKLPRLVTYVPELINTATFCKHTVSSTAPSDSRGTYPFSNALDGYKEARSFWMSAPGVDNVVVDVDLGTRVHLQRIELHWRSNFSPRHYTVEVSEEGRQWFLVHRSIVDPSKGEGDVVKKEEDHITVCHLSYGTDRRDVILLRDDSASTVNSALPSTGVQHLRVHMTKRWFNTYRINQLEAWGDVIPGASYVSVDMKDKTIAFKDA